MQETTRRAEFESICIPFTRMLYGAAVRLTRRPEDAGDLVQETFLRAYRTFGGFQPGSNAKAWLFTILYSVFVNRYRKERRAPQSIPLEEVEERFLVARDAGDSDWATRSASAQELDAALRALPEVFRAAILLVDVEGLTYEEASSALECPVGTLRSRLSRGRRELFLRLSQSPAFRGGARQVEGTDDAE